MRTQKEIEEQHKRISEKIKSIEINTDAGFGSWRYWKAYINGLEFALGTDEH
jgi:hypothetical protein